MACGLWLGPTHLGQPPHQKILEAGSSGLFGDASRLGFPPCPCTVQQLRQHLRRWTQDGLQTDGLSTSTAIRCRQLGFHTSNQDKTSGRLSKTLTGVQEGLCTATVRRFTLGIMLTKGSTAGRERVAEPCAPPLQAANTAVTGAGSCLGVTDARKW